VPAGIPPSAGALIDRAGLKGTSNGGAQVSLTHANFIINTGAATATEIKELVERCRAAVAERFGVVLRDEIMTVGEF
jgi:UDP-N-acetylmuramate dehydrogenase